jgi:hypothetical protein
MSKHSDNRPLPENETPSKQPISRNWADRALYRSLIGSGGGDGGGFSDLGGYTDGLDVEILEDPPWSVR